MVLEKCVHVLSYEDKAWLLNNPAKVNSVTMLHIFLSCYWGEFGNVHTLFSISGSRGGVSFRTRFSIIWTFFRQFKKYIESMPPPPPGGGGVGASYRKSVIRPCLYLRRTRCCLVCFPFFLFLCFFFLFLFFYLTLFVSILLNSFAYFFVFFFICVWTRVCVFCVV